MSRFDGRLLFFPSHAETHTNYAMALLQCGDFEQG